MKENVRSLSGVFVVFIILTPNLLASPNKCMGLLQYIFQEVVAEEWSSYNVYEAYFRFTFESVKNIKAIKYWIYLLIFFFREDELDPESNKVQLLNLAKFSNDTCVLKQDGMNFKYLCQSEIKPIKIWTVTFMESSRLFTPL